MRYQPRLNNSITEVLGPGSRYQIDATILDIYVVSEIDRSEIVGRPTFYKIVDVFSRMTVGIYVGLEAPSWQCALMALLNVLEDKVEFCKRYGVHIEPEEWEIAEFPVAILGDRGEMESTLADILAIQFGIEIENTPPYRGDLKGVVEREFRATHAKLRPYAPGFVEPDFRKRGAHDYRLDSELTVKELTATVILSVLEGNNTERRNYPGNPAIVADKTEYIPSELYRWGKQNFTSDGRRFDYEQAKLYLTPQDTVTVTKTGLRFRYGLYYFNPEMMKENWYLPAQETKEKLKISYHPGDISEIIVFSPHEKNRVFHCKLTPACEQFMGLLLPEVDEFRHRERQIRRSSAPKSEGRKIGYDEDRKKIYADTAAK